MAAVVLKEPCPPSFFHGAKRAVPVGFGFWGEGGMQFGPRVQQQLSPAAHHKHAISPDWQRHSRQGPNFDRASKFFSRLLEAAWRSARGPASGLPVHTTSSAVGQIMDDADASLAGFDEQPCINTSSETARVAMTSAGSHASVLSKPAWRIPKMLKT